MRRVVYSRAVMNRRMRAAAAAAGCGSINVSFPRALCVAVLRPLLFERVLGGCIGWLLMS